MADEIVLHVTEANYEDTVVKCDKPVLLAIGAPWCIDCKRIDVHGICTEVPRQNSVCSLRFRY